MSLIVNGTLTRIDAQAAPSPAGVRSWATGATLAADALVDEPTQAQLIALAGVLAKVDAVIYVETDQLPANQQINPGDRVTANQTGLSSITYEVMRATCMIAVGLDHWRLFVTERT